MRGRKKQQKSTETQRKHLSFVVEKRDCFKTACEAAEELALRLLQLGGTEVEFVEIKIKKINGESKTVHRVMP